MQIRYLQLFRCPYWFIALGIGLLGYALAATAANGEIANNNPQSQAGALFATDEVLEVELRGPFEKLLEDESRRQRTFQIIANDIQQSVGVRAGGKSRRRVCEFLPLRLDFETFATASASQPDSVFKGHNFLYFTAHCRHTERSQADLIEEYLTYRILNLLTESSYRVRLLRVKYVDTRREDKSMTYYAFVTESQHMLAHRMGGQVLDINQVPKRRLNEEHAAIIYVFQYLIGNTDWSLVAGGGDDMCCHNGQLIEVGSEIFYVPFDFDLAGLVNPHYAYPDRSLPIERVTQRLYRGYCGPEEALRRAIEHVVSQRDAILDLYRAAPALSPTERDKGITFPNRFFEKAEDTEELLSDFQKRCLD